MTTAAAPETQALVARARDVLQQLAVLLRNSYLHELTNEVFAEPLDKAVAGLNELLAREGSVRLERVGQELFVNGVRLRMELRTLETYKFVRGELERRAVGGLAVVAPVTPRALVGLLTAFARVRRASEEEGAAAVNAALDEQGVAAIRALEPRPAALEDPSEEAALDRRQRAIQAYQQALDFIRESMRTVDSPAQLNVRKAKRTVQRLVDLSYEEGDGFSLAGLAAIKAHNDYTFNHMVNVCILAIAFGQRLGLRRQELAQLGLCALYHDMGKLHIPLEILNSKTELTEEEWAVMGNHTVYAARTLLPLVAADRGTIHRIFAALQHHLRYDGTGYPRLRLRRRQTLFARITAIVDTFDAMTTKRLYQKQYLPDEAMAVLQRGAGTRYDPLLVKAFVNCMGIFPVGSTVLLTTGELAVVVESNPDPERVHQPRVRIVTDARRRPRDATELVDLAAAGEAGRAIVKCVDPEPFGLNAAHYAF